MRRKADKLQELMKIPGLLKEILETSVQGIIILRHDKKTLTTVTFYANERAGTIIGVKASDLIDIDPAEYLHPEDDKVAQIELYTKVLTGQSVEMGLKLLPHDGLNRSIKVMMERISQTETESYVLCLLTDLSEQEESNFKLKQNEKFFRNFLERLPALVFVLEDDGTISYANQAAVKLTGYSSEPIGRLNVMSILDRDGQILLLQTRQELDEGKSPGIKPFKIKTVNGDYIPVDGTAVTLIVGSVVKFVGIAVDVSGRIEAEQEREKMRLKLIQTQKFESLGVMAGGVAHDFNNILTGVRGYLGLAQRTIPSDSSSQKHLQSIDDLIIKLTDLANQMMVYAGIRKFSIKSFHFNELIKDMVLMLQSSISKKTNLRLNLEPHLPFITGDITQVRQVIMNLVINASEACGTNTGDILVSTKKVWLPESSKHLLPEQIVAGDYILLEITDTGCGMDAETLHKMFDPFFSTKFTGRGLGLAAVLGIIKGHRGGINVYSVPGQGTTIKVYFPVLEENQSLPAVDSEVSQTEFQIKRRLSGKTILVVDDEMVIRDTFSQYLFLYGCEVLVAEDGLAGLAMYLKYCDKIDVVILDLTMPNLSGKEVLIEIKKRNPLVKIILMSGWAEEEALKSFRHGDVAAFMPKPPIFEDLIAKLLEVLGAN